MIIFTRRRRIRVPHDTTGTDLNPYMWEQKCFLFTKKHKIELLYQPNNPFNRHNYSPWYSYGPAGFVTVIILNPALELDGVDFPVRMMFVNGTGLDTIITCFEEDETRGNMCYIVAKFHRGTFHHIDTRPDYLIGLLVTF